MTALPPSQPHALEALDLTVVLGGAGIIDVPSMAVRRNEVLVAIGPNGCGKTTLMSCLALLLKPATGSIAYNGVRVVGNRTALLLRRRIAVVFQQSLLLDTTVLKNVTLGMRLRGVSRKEAESRAALWLERLGVLSLSGRQARNLSGGEAQRVSLARAFSLNPEVLFLDEPFTALDTPTRLALIDEFEGVLRETKVTTFMVTHDRNEALILADRVAVLIKGHICQIGTPGEVFTSPADEQVAEFVGVENILPGKVVEQKNGIATVRIATRNIASVSPIKEGSSVTACLRPEDITLSTAMTDGGASSARNHLTGKVSRISPLGSQVRATIDCGFQVIALITRISCQELALVPGVEVLVSFKASSVHLIRRSCELPL